MHNMLKKHVSEPLDKNSLEALSQKHLAQLVQFKR